MNQVFFRHFLCFLSLFWVASLSAKSRLGEYYLGFGYSMADGDKQRQQASGDILSIMANSPATQSSRLATWRWNTETTIWFLVLETKLILGANLGLHNALR